MVAISTPNEQLLLVHAHVGRQNTARTYLCVRTNLHQTRAWESGRRCGPSPYEPGRGSRIQYTALPFLYAPTRPTTLIAPRRRVSFCHNGAHVIKGWCLQMPSKVRLHAHTHTCSRARNGSRTQARARVHTPHALNHAHTLLCLTRK